MAAWHLCPHMIEAGAVLMCLLQVLSFLPHSIACMHQGCGQLMSGGPLSAAQQSTVLAGVWEFLHGWPSMLWSGRQN